MGTNNKGAADSRSTVIKKGVIALLFSFIAFGASKGVELALKSDTIAANYIVIMVRLVISFIPFVLLGGMKWLDLKNNSVKKTFKFCKPLMIMCFINILMNVASVYQNGVKEGAPLRVLLVIPLSFLVGLNEELVFRGLMSEGFHAILGKKKNHALHAALLGAVIFGASHVIFSLDFSNIYGILTSLMKTITAAMGGVIFFHCCLFYKDMIGSVVFHAVYDGISLAIGILCKTDLHGSYTSVDKKTALTAIIMYTVTVLVFLPKTIKAIKKLANCELTDGIYGDGGDAVTDPDETSPKKKEKPAKNKKSK